jgi:dipeptidyl aminopeptidase/acylaminoacyl peptidase
VRRSRRVLFALALQLAGACDAKPPHAAPPPPPSSRPETTLSAPAASASPQGLPEPELVVFTSGSLTLHGFLYRPSGTGPFPAIVLNHGSETLPGWKPDQAMFYVPRGFVLFLPHRRGQGRSADAGANINNTPATGAAFVDALVAQNDDVMAAIAYVAALPYVDPKRIAVVGCSLGGIESLFAAERGTGIVAAIDFAGASITWAGNPLLQERMKAAARSARVPVFFVQAENDYNTAPSRELFAEMQKAGKPSGMHIFPPNGSTPQEGHSFCAGGPDPPWGGEVLAFLNEAMNAPASVR